METNSMNLQRVSVVVPAKNEEQYISQCLESLFAVDYPRDLVEIIVVDNGSTDKTQSIAEQMGVKVISKINCFVGAVRNAGVDVSSGTVIVFIDSDCVVEPGYLKAAVAALNISGVGAVGGGCLAPETGTWVERIWPDGEPESREVKALAASSFAIKRQIFETVGRFNENLTAGEDDELSNRVALNGYTLQSIKECWVVHLGYPKTLFVVAKRQIWHGSHQLQSAASILDSMVVLTHSFLFSVILLPFALASTSSFVNVLGIILNIFGPIVLAIKKGRKKTQRHAVMSRIAVLSVVFYFFLVGRAIGLFKSYASLFIKISSK